MVHIFEETEFGTLLIPLDVFLLHVEQRSFRQTDPWFFKQLLVLLSTNIEDLIEPPEDDQHKPPEVEGTPCEELQFAGRCERQKRHRTSEQNRSQELQITLPGGVRERMIQYFFSGRQIFHDELVVTAAFDASNINKSDTMLGIVADWRNSAMWLPPQVASLICFCFVAY